MAVEILRAVELKAAHGFVVDALRQSDRVGHRYQNDFAAQPAGCLGLVQQGTQMECGQHAGQFFGVQARLHIHLGPLARRTVVKAAQVA